MFFVIFLITNILFSFIFWFFIIRYNTDNQIDNMALLLCALGGGPVFTSLLLYYLFLIVPKHSAQFYLGAVASVYLFLAIWGYRNFKLEKIKSLFSPGINILRGNLFFFSIWGLVIISGCVYFFIKILPTPLIGHDVLNYAIVGDMIFRAKSLDPIWEKDFFETGYHYKMTCAPAFSLILTWERICNNVWSGSQSDLYFRSIGPYYGWVIVCFQFYLISKKNIWIALLSCIALLSGIGFYLKILIPHIDTYRIFFGIFSYFFLVHAVKKTNALSMTLFGVFSGFSAYSHRLGLAIAVINCAVVLVMAKGPFYKKIMYGAFISLVILAFGGGHYVLDFILGLGTWLNI